MKPGVPAIGVICTVVPIWMDHCMVMVLEAVWKPGPVHGPSILGVNGARLLQLRRALIRVGSMMGGERDLALLLQVVISTTEAMLYVSVTRQRRRCTANRFPGVRACG